jgi:hypothetical protein
MTTEERVAEKALLRAMLAGIDLAHDLEGHVHLKLTICPYCETQLADFEAAKVHDATCEKHPAVIRLMRREQDIHQALVYLRQCADDGDDPENLDAYVGRAVEVLEKPEEAPDAE